MKNFYNHIKNNNKGISKEEIKKWVRVAKIYSEQRDGYREEFENIINIEDEVFEDYNEDDIYFGRLQFCIDYLNETIRDIEIIDNKMFFIADFKAYNFDQMLTGRFYISDEYINDDEFRADIDRNYKITINRE